MEEPRLTGVLTCPGGATLNCGLAPGLLAQNTCSSFFVSSSSCLYICACLLLHVCAAVSGHSVNTYGEEADSKVGLF